MEKAEGGEEFYNELEEWETWAARKKMVQAVQVSKSFLCALEGSYSFVKSKVNTPYGLHKRICGDNGAKCKL